jgi:hypothetical protein
MDEEFPYTVIDANGYVMCPSATFERANDLKWEIEHEGWPYPFVLPLTIVHDISWDGIKKP